MTNALLPLWFCIELWSSVPSCVWSHPNELKVEFTEFTTSWGIMKNTPVFFTYIFADILLIICDCDKTQTKRIPQRNPKNLVLTCLFINNLKCEFMDLILVDVFYAIIPFDSFWSFRSSFNALNGKKINQNSILFHFAKLLTDFVAILWSISVWWNKTDEESFNLILMSLLLILSDWKLDTALKFL